MSEPESVKGECNALHLTGGYDLLYVPEGIPWIRCDQPANHAGNHSGKIPRGPLPFPPKDEGPRRLVWV